MSIFEGNELTKEAEKRPSWVNSVMSFTVGPAWRAATGTVDPWTLANLHKETEKNIRRATGNRITEAGKEVFSAEAIAEQDDVLRKDGAHPGQVADNIAGGFKKIADFSSATLRIGAFVLGAFLVLKVLQVLGLPPFSRK